MSFVDRRKKAILWRDPNAAQSNPYPPATQVVADVLAGVAHSYADNTVKKAFARNGIQLPDDYAHLLVDAAAEVGKSVVQKVMASRAIVPPKKKKAKAKGKAAA